MKKIFSVCKKLFGWIIFWTIIHFLRTSEIYDIWDNTTQVLVAGGIEPVAWFLFTYCILLVISPIIHKFCKGRPAIFSVCVILWMIFVATGKFDWIRDTKPQSLWIYLYLGYFSVGMFLAFLHQKIEEYSKIYNKMVIVDCVIFMLSTAVYYREVFIKMSILAPHQHYGTWYYSLWLVSMFCILRRFNIKNEHVKNILKTISGNTFTVYLAHLPILLFFTALHPLGSIEEAIICIIVLFVLTEVMAVVFKKLPLLRKIV